MAADDPAISGEYRPRPRTSTNGVDSEASTQDVVRFTRTLGQVAGAEGVQVKLQRSVKESGWDLSLIDRTAGETRLWFESRPALTAATGAPMHAACGIAHAHAPAVDCRAIGARHAVIGAAWCMH